LKRVSKKKNKTMRLRLVGHSKVRKMVLLWHEKNIDECAFKVICFFDDATIQEAAVEQFLHKVIKLPQF